MKSILLTVLFSLSSLSVYADSKNCIIHTDNQLAQEFLVERGYQVVYGDDNSADLVLKMEAKYLDMVDTCGFVSCKTTVSGKVDTKLETSKKIIILKNDEKGTNSITGIGGIANRYPELDYDKLYNRSFKKLEKALNEYKGCNL